MTKGALAAALLWFSLAAPAAARDPLAKLPPAPRPAGAPPTSHSDAKSRRQFVPPSRETHICPPPFPRRGAACRGSRRCA
jgi:hypothetical protein